MHSRVADKLERILDLSLQSGANSKSYHCCLSNLKTTISEADWPLAVVGSYDTEYQSYLSSKVLTCLGFLVLTKIRKGAHILHLLE